MALTRTGGPRESVKFSNFSDSAEFGEGCGERSIARYIMRTAYGSRVKFKTFCRHLFAISFPKSGYGSPNFANFVIFEFFSKFNTNFSARK